MKALKVHIVTIAAFMLLYLTYVSGLSFLAQNYFFTCFTNSADSAGISRLSYVKQGGMFPACLLGIVFVYALWLLGCVKTRPLLDVLPAFLLCVLWASFSVANYFSKPESVALRYLTGGGVLMFGYTGFASLYGLYRAIRYKDAMVWDARRALKLCALVAVIYVLDNTAYFIGDSLLNALQFSLSKVLNNTFVILVYPFTVGCICASSFIRANRRRAAVGAVLIAVGAVYTVLTLFPFSLISSALKKIVSDAMVHMLLCGSRARAWPYMTGALIFAGIMAVRKKTRTVDSSIDTVSE